MWQRWTAINTWELLLWQWFFWLLPPHQCRCGSVCGTAAESLCSTRTVLLHRRPTRSAAPAPANTGKERKQTQLDAAINLNLRSGGSRFDCLSLIGTDRTFSVKHFDYCVASVSNTKSIISIQKNKLAANYVSTLICMFCASKKNEKKLGDIKGALKNIWSVARQGLIDYLYRRLKIWNGLNPVASIRVPQLALTI